MREIFVFGSNLAGIHGKGAALEAKKNWGAVEGIGVGLQGQSYAIPTKIGPYKTRPLEDIAESVFDFLQFAKEHSELTFHITPIGCGLAGYSPRDIAPMFVGRSENCLLPTEFKEVLEDMIQEYYDEIDGTDRFI